MANIIMKYKKAVVFDVETTGLNPEENAIIQVSACDINGNPLLNTYIRPGKEFFEGEKLQQWIAAAKVNRIHPYGEEIAQAPFFAEVQKKIQKLFDEADLLIAYNGQFDMRFLSANGIRFKEKTPYYDVMLAFAEYNGEWNDEKQAYKWKKLGECAVSFDYEFNAHDSAEDVKATAYSCLRLWENNIQLTEKGKVQGTVSDACPDIHFKKVPARPKKKQKSPEPAGR